MADVNNLLDGACYLTGDIQGNTVERRLKAVAVNGAIQVVDVDPAQTNNETWVRVRDNCAGAATNTFRLLSLNNFALGTYMCCNPTDPNSAVIISNDNPMPPHLESLFTVIEDAHDLASYSIINSVGNYLTISDNGEVYFQELQTSPEGHVPPKQKWKFTPMPASSGYVEQTSQTGN